MLGHRLAELCPSFGAHRERPLSQQRRTSGTRAWGTSKGEAAPWEATVEDVAEVLFSGKASGAVFAHTGAASQAQGAEGGGPEGIRLSLQPA